MVCKNKMDRYTNNCINLWRLVINFETIDLAIAIFHLENRRKLLSVSLEMMRSTTIRTRQFHHDFLTILIFERINSGFKASDFSLVASCSFSVINAQCCHVNKSRDNK